jgi:BirA family biotin operon repressor/biotin-[acetyl-CoA-carboxylase] ligase
MTDAAELAAVLATRRIGRRARWLEVTASTNRDAMESACAGEPEGLAIVADRQTAGRGRMTRPWFSPPGANLYVSLVLRPEAEAARVATLPLVAGLAIAEALDGIAPRAGLAVKWPNDIWIKRRKVCGILCEMQSQGTGSPAAVVLGFGLNVNICAEELPPELQGLATSLRIATGRTFRRAEVLGRVLNVFERRYDEWLAGGLEPLLPALGKLDALRGSRVSMALVGQPATGIAEGIQPDGGLRIRGADGTVTAVYSGEVHIGTPAGE